MGTPVFENTNPEELRRKLQSGGPIGFVMAVYETLRRLGRPYYYAAAAPDWLLANRSEVDAFDFGALYGEFFDETTSEKSFQTIPHCIIHQYRMYPAKRRYAGTNDSPAGTRRQKTPSSVIYHDRPLPESEGDYFAEDAPQVHVQSALTSTGRRPPLWSSREDIPDLIRDEVQEDTICQVQLWEYDVFVDFVLTAENMYVLEQMHKDLLMILRTFHDRNHTGASNLTGWFYQSISGTPADMKLRGDFPTRTITWRLKQTEAYAFPTQVVADIELTLFGEE